MKTKKRGMFFLNILYWASALGHEIAIILSGSSSVVDPDDYKLCEWLFPWFCGFVQLEQWPHCNPRLFTFQQISSYWNHGEGRAGVKEDSHAPYLYKTNTCLTQDPHLVNNPQWSKMKGWQCVINTSLTKISFIFPSKSSTSLPICLSILNHSSFHLSILYCNTNLCTPGSLYFPFHFISHELLSGGLELPL